MRIYWQTAVENGNIGVGYGHDHGRTEGEKMRSIAMVRRIFAAALACTLAAPVCHGAHPPGPLRVLAGGNPPPAAPASELPPTRRLAQAAKGLNRRYSGTPIDVLTFHYDNLRTGWNQSETDLTPANVRPKTFGLLTTLSISGEALAQPLLVSGFTLPDSTVHDILVIATSTNMVYAFDANSYAVLWQVSLGTPQSSADLKSTNVTPYFGISSTPAIVRAGSGAATIYVVTATEPSKDVFVSQLHALDLRTGSDILPPVVIAPSAKLLNKTNIVFSPQDQWNRTGLAWNNGSLYIGFGSHSDYGLNTTSGWLLNYNSQLQLQQAFHTVVTKGKPELSSIWMSGFAPAIDASGNVFVATGNGQVIADDGEVMGYGQSVLKLSPSLASVISSFTPAAWETLNAHDNDLGSGGVMLLPAQSGQTAPPMAVAMGKSATLYLLSQTQLGGLQPNDAGALQTITLPTSLGVWGGPAYYAGPAGAFVYYQTYTSVLRQFAVSAGTPPALTQAAVGTTKAGYGGSMPVVSSNGAAAGTALVWLVRRTSPLELEAYDAVKLGKPVYAAQAGTWSGKSNSNGFISPLVANGRVYVAADGTVDVFGLAP
jgi:outer membrane protein assembly factor BamB